VRYEPRPSSESNCPLPLAEDLLSVPCDSGDEFKAYGEACTARAQVQGRTLLQRLWGLGWGPRHNHFSPQVHIRHHKSPLPIQLISSQPTLYTVVVSNLCRSAFPTRYIYPHGTGCSFRSRQLLSWSLNDPLLWISKVLHSCHKF
jgi:hypothetical protein